MKEFCCDIVIFMSYQTFKNEANINKNHMDRRYMVHFQSDTHFDKLSLAICQSDFISKKEYCESIEVVRHIQRFIKSNQQMDIYDICGGHGFVGILLSMFSKGVARCHIVDKQRPMAFDKMISCLSEISPQTIEKICFIQTNYKNVEFKPNSLLIGIHACGLRTDSILDTALENNSGVVLLPCCYTPLSIPGQMRKFTNVYELRELVDIYRITKALDKNFKTHVRTISEDVTPMNRLFVFLPEDFRKNNSG